MTSGSYADMLASKALMAQVGDLAQVVEGQVWLVRWVSCGIKEIKLIYRDISRIFSSAVPPEWIMEGRVFNLGIAW